MFRQLTPRAVHAGNVDALINRRYARSHGDTSADSHSSAKHELVGPLRHRWLVRLGFVLVEERAGDDDRKCPLLGDSGRSSLFRI
jgi:hypothetical protein